ncbi:DUF2752 domain-containing protein [Allorhizocola rhizosphaerae]|uniref:DUF2752 domain-containing protein n=1 Tax=Allorhizocola rhizosphaerae TaxID=1872709 RepID=UPI000E3CD22A|nr:DUF2752 domain-containing protein [Allorhizocola rhizosphaerae]
MTEAHAHYTDSPVLPPHPVGRFARLRARTPAWLAPLAVLGCVGAALGYTAWANPAAGGADAMPTCLIKLTTGLDCPGCGGTRAAWYLMQGDIPAAARHHLLFVFAVPFVLYMYVAWAGKVAFGWRLPQIRIGPAVVGIFLGAWGLFMVMRNLPWEPFTYFYV